MIEALLVTVLIISGALLLRAFGMRGWGLLPLGSLTGVGLFLILGYVQAHLHVPATPVFPIGFTLLLPGILYWRRHEQGYDVSFRWLPALLSLGAVALFVIFIAEANLFKIHYDSIRYLIAGSLLYNGEISSFSMNLLGKRFFSTSVLHSLGHFADSFHFRAIQPVISLSLLGSIGWIAYEGLKTRVSRPRLLTLIILGILLLLSSHPYLWHSFYINGHLLMSAFLVTTVGSGWLLTQKAEPPAHALAALGAISTIGLVLTRPEGAILAGLALLPILVNHRVRFRHRALFLLAYGSAILLHYGFVMVTTHHIGNTASLATLSFMAIGATAILAIPALGWRWMLRKPHIILYGVEGLLWLVVGILFLYEPGVTYKSINSTTQNVIFGAGNWGLSFVIIGSLLVLMLLLKQFQYQIMARFTVTTFVPFSLLLAYLRGGGYRVGMGDSFNRMLFHIIPLVVLFIIIAAASRYTRFSSRDEAIEATD